jgi:acetyl esterase/lipase
MKNLIFLSALILVGCASKIESPKPIAVWEGTPPGEVLTPKPGADPRGSYTTWEGNQYLTDIFTPEFIPWPAAKPNSPIVIVCPGGGYRFLSEKFEGKVIAQKLNQMGCAAVVLHYRVPRRDNDKPWIQPLLDARRTLEIVRARAAEWNGNPKNVGILGFSAGGNLAARVAYAPADPEPPRPDFAVMVYSAYLFDEAKKPEQVLLSGPDGVVPAPKPKVPVPAFFAHSNDDKLPAEASAAMASKLKSMGGSSEVHIWADGGHGWAGTDRCDAAREWMGILEVWMKNRGILPR